MRIMGLDLSLTSTGVATDKGVALLRPPKSVGAGWDRLLWIRQRVMEAVFAGRIERVFVEGYAFGRFNKMAALGELGGVIRLSLYEAGIEFVEVPPTTVKKYATGSGNADKKLVLAEAIRRLGYQGASDDEADALWLYAIGKAAVGEPIVTVPAKHLDALKKWAMTIVRQ